MRRRSANLYLVIAMGSVLVIILGIEVNLLLNRPRHKAAPEPVAAPVAAGAPSQLVRVPCSPAEYAAILKRDAARYGVPPVSVETIARPLAGGVELRGPRTLTLRRNVLETPHLVLTVSVGKVGSSRDGTEGFRADHLILSIQNRTGVSLAYRVLTRLPGEPPSAIKAEIPHNAIALRPHETLRRTEGLYHTGQELQVDLVEVYELTGLGYFYVSKMSPEKGGPFDLRVAGAHDFAGLPPCRSLPWRGLGGPPEEVFHTVIDFHARHDCDLYSVPADYRPFAVAEPGKLPVCDNPASASAGPIGPTGPTE